LLDAIAVTDGPVDLFSLANNLYATGEISLALQIYQRLLATNLRDTDRVWVTYQIANCHRHLGNGSEAERAYRQIAGEKSVPSWSATARWWLDANNRTRQLQDMSQRLRTAIQELEGTKNANTNQ
jgi:tetratricopeptide (TPR) repeat protein